jgi:hypothetical protein
MGAQWSARLFDTIFILQKRANEFLSEKKKSGIKTNIPAAG